MSVLAQTTGDPGGSAGYIALLIVVLMGIATVLLVRNMSGRLKRLPREFPAEERDPLDPDSPPDPRR